MEYERLLQLLTPSTGLALLRVVCCAGTGHSLIRWRPRRSDILHPDVPHICVCGVTMVRIHETKLTLCGKHQRGRHSRKA